VSKSYISENLRLFVLAEAEDRYIMFVVDLDKYEDEIEKEHRILTFDEVFAYDKTDVMDEPILDFIVRANDPISNKNLFAFFLHRGSLWYWKLGSDHIE
jgi:hypothetical protein